MIDLKSLKAKRFHILGYGISGIAAAHALQAAGKSVTVWDDKAEKQAQARSQGFAIAEVIDADVLVVSPGVIVRDNGAHPVVTAARAQKIEITNDIGLFRTTHPKKTLVAITGTNGKSTTTALIGHVLERAGRNVAVGGNLGTPVLALADDADIYVLELSSYQLETAPALNAEVAVLLNITPDHIDHHGSMEGYIAAKARVFDGARTCIRSEGLDYQSGRFGTHDLTALDRLRGAHNWQNVATCFAACRALGLADNAIWDGVQSFPGLPHRQFMVRRIGQVAYVNDSKATNADATQKALRSFDDIFLIAGGLPKEGGLNGLEEDMGSVRHVYLIGDAQNEFATWLAARDIAHTKCGAMDRAVAEAHKAAQETGRAATVLLSPACASFDQFQSFEHRGKVFEELVNRL